MPRILIACLLLVVAWPMFAATPAEQQALKEKEAQAQQVVEALDAPLYNPFVERYVLDELKQLRVEQAATKHELIQQIVDREHKSVDRAVAYATDTVTYFFYLIAAATSVLVIVGWSSIREIKERVHTLADEEITKLIHEYEKRLETIEAQLQQKTLHIEENREEIELTQESQSLWLRAQQESSSANKIRIYDELLKLRPNDCEALTYKADAVLELDEPQWAANLCHQALIIDKENSHAFYQLACAYTAMQQFDEAIKYLSQAISRQESYREGLNDDPALTPLLEKQDIQEIINGL
ncbi:tetratricopeptide repeat protein [Motilimonas cestriensis]|uniref:Tetratricopeptide repeat protein n=1 Tax=Motilimonas cestriensis TaxID=2742685 RepID=A0ABS8W499_9GAMM|nr:tetratricopeptide repeat protein [Motilimonas cestriensis]MCE2593784.1 tetratricopeptide repeat protein [Motilimonas cestriensis]